jgi:copper chaperone
MKKIVLGVEPLSCPSCIKKIETALKRTDGVEEAKVMFHSNKVKASFNEEIVDADSIQSVITNLGYPVLSQKIS